MMVSRCVLDREFTPFRTQNQNRIKRKQRKQQTKRKEEQKKKQIMMQFGTKTLSLLFTSMLLSVSMVEGQLDSVSLGTAGDFAIVSRTGVTNTGVTAVIGDLGISPIGVTAYTGFSLTLDGTFSTSPSVTGELYAADHADPTPAKMRTAISDMQTAYNDAAGRVNPDYTEHGAGAIQGFTLTQGLYKWGTNVGITSSLYFDGGVAPSVSPSAALSASPSAVPSASPSGTSSAAPSASPSFAPSVSVDGLSDHVWIL